MISARPPEEREEAFDSWASHDVIVYDTTRISKDFNKHHSDCPEIGHFQRVFHAYIEVFKSVLANYPVDEDFIFLEDDAILCNFQQLHSELCMARRNGLQFYSFYHAEKQVCCAIPLCVQIVARICTGLG